MGPTPPPKILVGSFSDLAGGAFECWHDGLFTCAKTYCCEIPCISIGTIAEETDGTGCMKMGLFACCSSCHPCIHASMTLSALREKHGIEPGCVRDCLMHWCCAGCARAQELRFVNAVRKQQLSAALAGQKTVVIGQYAPQRQMM